jgi:quercetin dioxygenase-like cupin family protein
MKRIGVLLWLVLVLAVSAHWIGYAEQTASQPAPGAQGADDPRFTGKTVVMDGKELSVARRRFEPGARSAWHSHDKGQLLMVEEGRLRTQKRGQSVKEFGVGESDYTGPNIVHWHGAVPGQALVQINVGFGGETKWMDKVTDAEYGIKK